ncbi:Hypothetical predicted protein [Scomber scombrus]|uniref:Uncharacterized protein n=1 Tax=Scomber scombrus TaxID=13677 RepID=A0AAV1Q6Z6_SCOSC
MRGRMEERRRRRPKGRTRDTIQSEQSSVAEARRCDSFISRETVGPELSRSDSGLLRIAASSLVSNQSRMDRENRGELPVYVSSASNYERLIRHIRIFNKLLRNITAPHLDRVMTSQLLCDVINPRGDRFISD